MYSSRAGNLRLKRTRQGRSDDGSKRRERKGTATSTTKPVSVTRPTEWKTVSHAKLYSPSSVTRMSCCTPSGFIQRWYARRPSP